MSINECVNRVLALAELAPADPRMEFGSWVADAWIYGYISPTDYGYISNYLGVLWPVKLETALDVCRQCKTFAENV